MKRYLDLLELLFVIKRVPAWSSNLTTRAIATPKRLVVDSGIAGHLTGLTPTACRTSGGRVGPIIENFVLGPLARQLTCAQEPVRLYHFRDRDSYEVDAVLEHASGGIAGLVLYCGGRTLSFGERRWVLPVSTLWLS